jgi:hypothetical protein
MTSVRGVTGTFRHRSSPFAESNSHLCLQPGAGSWPQAARGYLFRFSAMLAQDQPSDALLNLTRSHHLARVSRRFPVLLRIERIPQRVAEQVEAKHGSANCHAGKY